MRLHFIRARRVAASLGMCALFVSISLNMPIAEPLELLRLQSMSVKAIGLYRAGDTKGAVAIATDVAEETRQVFGPNHIRFAQALNNLAIFHDEMGAIHRSEELYRQAIQITKTQPAPDGLQLAELQNNLAAIVLQQCKLADALALYRQASDATEHALGARHPDTRLINENVERLERYLMPPVATRDQSVIGQLAPASIKVRSNQIDRLLLRCMS